MRRAFSVIPLVLVVVALPLTAAARQQTAASGRATVKVAFNAKLKLKILVDARGFTLYVWESDSRNKSTCYAGCAPAWPPLTTRGAPIAGRGVKRLLLRTTKRTDKTIQVTYNHHPLYTDAGSDQLGLQGDKRPGDINGHAFANWYAISPTGKPIHKLP
jgi:predicted lipoprotein with Yx(FWY)xxD motif